jgi:hypothetical protein
VNQHLIDAADGPATAESSILRPGWSTCPDIDDAISQVTDRVSPCRIAVPAAFGTASGQVFAGIRGLIEVPVQVALA